MINRVRGDPRFENVSEQALRKVKHVLLRALGVSRFEASEIEIAVLDLAAGDTLLLCTDGVTGELDKATIAGLLTSPESLQSVANAIIQATNEHGGRDNSTAVVICVDELSADDTLVDS